jgi:hypothetical protein
MPVLVPPPPYPQRLPRRLAAGQLAPEQLRLSCFGGGQRGGERLLVLGEQVHAAAVERALFGLEAGLEGGEAALAGQLGGASRLGLQGEGARGSEGVIE